jgi:hypothetical protein
MEMRDGTISIYVDASAQPRDCFSIKTLLRLGETDPNHPPDFNSAGRESTMNPAGNRCDRCSIRREFPVIADRP